MAASADSVVPWTARATAFVIAGVSLVFVLREPSNHDRGHLPGVNAMCKLHAFWDAKWKSPFKCRERHHVEANASVAACRKAWFLKNRQDRVKAAFSPLRRSG